MMGYRCGPAWLAIALAWTVGSLPAVAENTKLSSMVGLKGTCASLAMSGADARARCTGGLLNTAYTNGRTGFWFILSDGSLVDFSGDGAKQTKLDADNIVQPVDYVSFGKPIKSLKATGSCRYGNPFTGKATIVCEAQTAGGRFQGTFESDGGKPDVKKM